MRQRCAPEQHHSTIARLTLLRCKVLIARSEDEMCRWALSFYALTQQGCSARAADFYDSDDLHNALIPWCVNSWIARPLLQRGCDAQMGAKLLGANATKTRAPEQQQSLILFHFNYLIAPSKDAMRRWALSFNALTQRRCASQNSSIL